MSFIIVTGLIVVIISLIMTLTLFRSTNIKHANRYRRKRNMTQESSINSLSSISGSDDSSIEYVKVITKGHKSEEPRPSTQFNDSYSEDADVVLGLKERVNPVEKPLSKLSNKKDTNIAKDNNITKDNHITKDYDGKKSSQEGSSSSPLIVLYLKSPKERQYGGYELLQSLLSVGLRFGKMNIFHRHENKSGQGTVLFSVASAVEPGTFDLPKMGGYSCPGLTAFLSTSKLVNPQGAFDLMLETMNQLAEDLGGDILDEKRNPLTVEKISEIRQKIRTSKGSHESLIPRDKFREG